MRPIELGETVSRSTAETVKFTILSADEVFLFSVLSFVSNNKEQLDRGNGGCVLIIDCSYNGSSYN